MNPQMIHLPWKKKVLLTVSDDTGIGQGDSTAQIPASFTSYNYHNP